MKLSSTLAILTAALAACNSVQCAAVCVAPTSASTNSPTHTVESHSSSAIDASFWDSDSHASRNPAESDLNRRGRGDLYDIIEGIAEAPSNSIASPSRLNAEPAVGSLEGPTHSQLASSIMPSSSTSSLYPFEVRPRGQLKYDRPKAKELTPEDRAKLLTSSPSIASAPHPIGAEAVKSALTPEGYYIVRFPDDEVFLVPTLKIDGPKRDLSALSREQQVKLNTLDTLLKRMQQRAPPPKRLEDVTPVVPGKHRNLSKLPSDDRKLALKAAKREREARKDRSLFHLPKQKYKRRLQPEGPHAVQGSAPSSSDARPYWNDPDPTSTSMKRQRTTSAERHPAVHPERMSPSIHVSSPAANPSQGRATIVGQSYMSGLAHASPSGSAEEPSIMGSKGMVNSPQGSGLPNSPATGQHLASQLPQSHHQAASSSSHPFSSQPPTAPLSPTFDGLDEIVSLEDLTHTAD